MYNPDSAAIIVAPNGARKSKDDHIQLPIITEEIVTDVLACRDAGAAMVHLHARDNNGQHSLSIEDNTRVLQAVQDAVGDSIIIQLTTEAIGQYKPHQQMELIRETRPEAASFALKELIPNDSYISNAQKFFHWVADNGIIAQYILYSVEELQAYFNYIKKGILPNKNHHLLLVLGRYRKNLTAYPQDLIPFITEDAFKDCLIQEKINWSVCAFGAYEQKCLMSAILMGADVRVGFENNHLNNQGDIAKDNAQQVSDIVDICNKLNIKPHTADSYRTLLLS